MRTGILQAILASSLLASCMEPTEFDARIGAMAGRAHLDAELAHQCAADLRALADHDAVSVGAALGLLGGAAALGPTRRWPPALLAPRIREEIERREGAAEASQRAIEVARGVGPAALYDAVSAEQLGRDTRARLCRERDSAVALAAAGVRPPVPRDLARAGR